MRNPGLLLPILLVLGLATAASAAEPAGAAASAPVAPEPAVADPTATGATGAPPTPPGQLGLTKAMAIEVCHPQGERQYLARLVCPDGEHPPFERIGSVGPRSDMPTGLDEKQQDALLGALIEGRPLRPGETDYHTLDAYELSCGKRSVTVYLDMYHCDQPAPDTAPAGFSIIL